MTLYGIELWNPTTNQLVADISQLCTGRRFTVRRNRPETVDLSMHLSVAEDLTRSLGMSFREMFAVGITDIRIKRGNRYLVGARLNYALPDVADKESLQLRATGFLDLLKDRYLQVPTTITNQDIGAAMWSIINTTQSLTNGSFGFIQGTIQTSRPISEDLEPFATSIKDILIAFSERINSVDFAFTYDRKFTVYYPGIGTDKTELLFSYPGNIASVALPRDATQLVNFSINRGSGNGNAQVVETVANTASQASFARRERVDDYPAISVAATLDEKGQETVRLFSAPLTIPDVVLDGTIDPPLGSYWIGDRVRFSVPNRPAFAPLDGQTWRINEIAVSVDTNDHEDISLKVGLS